MPYKIFLIFQYFQNFASIYAQNSIKYRILGGYGHIVYFCSLTYMFSSHFGLFLFMKPMMNFLVTATAALYLLT